MATLGGFVNKTFLADPITMVVSGWRLLVLHGFYVDIGVTVWRVGGGFVIAAVIGVPLGAAMGAYKPIEAFFEPFISFARYLPASGFIPLLILLQGLGEDEKITIIWIGVFFQLVLMVMDIAHRVPDEMLNVAYTLGASRWTVFYKVFLPATFPEVVDALRITMGWAWTYLIVAELVAAEHGIGSFILIAERYLRADRIIAAIITIGILGLITDTLFAIVHRLAFPYVEKVRA